MDANGYELYFKIVNDAVRYWISKEVSIKALSNIANSNSLDCTKTIANTEIGNRKNSYDRIYEQLNDDIEDWKRFVEANCQGNECLEVDGLINSKRSKS